MEFPGGLSVWQLLVTTVPFTNNPSPKEQGPEPGQQVPLQFAPVPGMSVQFDADADGIVRCYGHVGFQMEGPDPLATVMITLGFQLDSSWLESGAKAGENGIRCEHYHVVPFCWSVPIAPGRHEVRLMSRVSEDCPVFFKPKQFSRMHVEVLGPSGGQRWRSRRGGIARLARPLAKATRLPSFFFLHEPLNV
jgi:hypothetical protein